MYLNDLNSAQHNVTKLNRVLADTFNHEVNLSEMSTDSLSRMLSTTNAKIQAIKESDLKYWENAQYNKLGLIAHQLKTYITEIAPTRADGKRMKTKESVVMENELEQAEVMLAAQELVDELQKMVEDIAEMQVQKLMPIVDAMKQQLGFEQAEAYNNAADAALGGLLDQMKSTKEAVENATLTARGEQPAQPAPTDMGMDDAAMDPEAPIDTDMGADEFGGDNAEAGEENSIGRELKGESALADMERGALAEKKFLESKGRLFKMVESGQMSNEHFINIISELSEDPIDPQLLRNLGIGMSKVDPPLVRAVRKKGVDDVFKRHMGGSKGGSITPPMPPMGGSKGGSITPPMDSRPGMAPSQPQSDPPMDPRPGMAPSQPSMPSKPRMQRKLPRGVMV